MMARMDSLEGRRTGVLLDEDGVTGPGESVSALVECVVKRVRAPLRVGHGLRSTLPLSIRSKDFKLKALDLDFLARF